MDAFRERVRAARPLKEYTPGLKITATDKMGPAAGMPRQYTYELTEPAGKNFHPGFKPAYSPGDMLSLGVFSGKYLNDCTGEFPREWFEAGLNHNRLCPGAPNPEVNLFRVKSRKSAGYWREKGWIPLATKGAAVKELDRDPRGWFQWYCRYWIGRRIPELDDAQIARWKAFTRHAGQITASYKKLAASPGGIPKNDKDDPYGVRWKVFHRPVQRQALLQWSHNPFV